ncbi:MFS general substrate transporter [Aspergillus steynii IBT 23096]|uniref:MFS general substrate transporter n=1 Tax=Aspergillus steynii IBT 23096 TaxID=1392250 RepID=A0A2I2G8U9_9EURO|nr:MFS general substrate transporter [Aspergillus steynii IBT 23096]PLB49306.1 MFS general substrate transporter [Aspergillus steynii IBT 23096]
MTSDNDQSVSEKGLAGFKEFSACNAAGEGQVATDEYGHSLIQLDPKAESRLRTKIDLYVVPTVAVLYLFCFIDRANIGNAKLAGFEADLNLTGNDFNTVLSVFFIAYIIFEIPCTIACKWIGPGWFIPAITLGFGICSLGTAFVHTIHSASGVRFLLGLFEAGMLPGIAYYLSRWYRRSELIFRISCYIVMSPLAGAFGGLLASGILKLDHFGSLHEWRMIFAIEGIVTIGLGIISFFTLTDRPETARWLSPEEKNLAIARVKSERVATSEVLDRLDRTKAMRGILNPATVGAALMFCLNQITVQGLGFFAPTIVKTIYPNSSVISQQLHTVPPYAVGAFFTLLFPFISWRIDRRLVIALICAPLMMIGYIMFLATTHKPTQYGATFLIASGSFTFGALVNAIASANVVSDTARSSAIGTTGLIGNIGGLISTWSYMAKDAPLYHVGNGLNLAAASATLLVAIALLLYMTWDNRRREKRDVRAELDGLSQKEVEDLDWWHPGFRWRP